MRKYFMLAVLAAFSCSACSGGSGTTAPTLPGAPSGGGNGGNTTQSSSTLSIASTNDVGTAAKTLTDYADDVSASPSGSQSLGMHAALGTSALAPSGACQNGIEFFSPDKAGDANSTERLTFYDPQCTQLARDAIRIFTMTSPSSQTVARTVSFYAPNNTTPIATRTDTIGDTHATFDQYGFPIPADGYDRTSSNVLSIAGAKTIDSSDELVMQPGTGSNAFCGDSAGFNATGVAKTAETFGWQGGVPAPGTRTVSSDGSVTWTATHTGTAFKGPIGGLTVVAGTQNTGCPITAPMFTLTGGTALGTYTYPVAATFTHGILTNLTVSNATLANGDSLNVTTSSGAPPSSSTFIEGIVTNGSTQISTFGVNAFGDGTLTVTAIGAQFIITDWHVIR